MGGLAAAFICPVSVSVTRRMSLSFENEGAMSVSFGGDWWISDEDVWLRMP